MRASAVTIDFAFGAGFSLKACAFLPSAYTRAGFLRREFPTFRLFPRLAVRGQAIFWISTDFWRAAALSGDASRHILPFLAYWMPR